MRVSARRNDLISIAPILVRLSRILHNNGTATAVLAVPVLPPLPTTTFAVVTQKIASQELNMWNLLMQLKQAKHLLY